jgi:hypothetical protein
MEPNEQKKQTERLFFSFTSGLLNKRRYMDIQKQQQYLQKKKKKKKRRTKTIPRTDLTKTERKVEPEMGFCSEEKPPKRHKYLLNRIFFFCK